MQKRLSQTEPLNHPFAEVFHQVLFATGEPNEFEELIPFRFNHAGRNVAEVAKILQRVVSRQVRRNPKSFRKIADKLATFLAASRMPHHRCLAAGFLDDPQQHFDERRLASTVGPQQSKNFALTDRKADALERLKLLPRENALAVGLEKLVSNNRRRSSTVAAYQFSCSYFIRRRYHIRSVVSICFGCASLAALVEVVFVVLKPGL